MQHQTVTEVATAVSPLTVLPFSALHLSKLNVRKKPGQMPIPDLAESIATQGLLQNLLVVEQKEKAEYLKDKAEYYRNGAAAVGMDGISSDDPKAIDKLRAELESRKAHQERMKQANRIIRLHAGDHDVQIRRLVALGRLTIDQARDLVRPDYVGRVGYPCYAMTNNSANIRRIEQRIEALARRSR